jgi:hypothetical protein
MGKDWGQLCKVPSKGVKSYPLKQEGEWWQRSQSPERFEDENSELESAFGNAYKACMSVSLLRESCMCALSFSSRLDSNSKSSQRILRTDGDLDCPGSDPPLYSPGVGGGAIIPFRGSLEGVGVGTSIPPD